MDLRRYVQHLPECTYDPRMGAPPDSDFCTCGFLEAREAFAALQMARKNRGSLGCDSCDALVGAIDNVTTGGINGPRVRRL